MPTNSITCVILVLIPIDGFYSFAHIYLQILIGYQADIFSLLGADIFAFL